MGERIRWVWVALFGLLWCPACANSNTRDMGVDGESHFLEICEEQCDQGLSCLDGICTQRCDALGQCRALSTSATCERSSGDSGESRCDVVCTSNAGCSALGSDFACFGGLCRQASESTRCRRKGRYQAGKEGSYLPCCDGLREVFWQTPATDAEGTNVCVEPMHREYGCVENECGDGRCEPGEDGACGCAADCPDARRESGAAGDACFTGSDCQSGTCEGEGCSDDQPGVCTPPSRSCTDDDVPFCGCDGTTFTASGSCPAARFRHEGECDQDDLCEAAQEAFQDFLSEHRSCDTATDCTHVGDCDPHIKHEPVRVDAATEARRLQLQTCGSGSDGGFDGSRCESGQCVSDPGTGGCCGCIVESVGVADYYVRYESEGASPASLSATTLSGDALALLVDEIEPGTEAHIFRAVEGTGGHTMPSNFFGSFQITVAGEVVYDAVDNSDWQEPDWQGVQRYRLSYRATP